MPWNTAIHQTMTEAEFAAGVIANSDQGKRLGSNLENHDTRISAVEGSQRADALAVIPRELPPFGMSVTPEWFWKNPVVNGSNGKQGVGGETFILGGLLVPRADPNFAWLLFASKSGKIKVGSYVGDGAVGNAITGVGFQPDILIPWKNGSESTGSLGFFTTKDAIADSGGILTTSFAGVKGSQIQSLDADGFTLNTTGDPNALGVTYNYLALKVTSDATLKIDAGTYAGDGAGGGQSVTGLGYTPQLVLATVNINQPNGDFIGSACRSHETASGSETVAFNLAGEIFVAATGGIQILSDGFKVFGTGSGSRKLNRSGDQYLYVALAGGAITM